MSAFAGGDRSAFDSLYTRHEVSMLRFVRRMLGQRFGGEADEAFREIWLRIVEERDEFGAAGTPWRRWAFRIARGIALERLRLSGRDAAYHAHDEDGDGIEAARMFGRGLLRAEGESGAAAADEGRSEEEDAFWRAAGRRVLNCLEELPDDERAAFLLHQQESFGIEDLAYMLGVDEDGVRSRLRKGLKKLRTCMERYLAVLGAAPVDEDAADDGELRDVYLEEMLVSAPDMGAVLDWRLGKALLASAHEAVMGSAPDFADLDAPSGAGRAMRYGALALVVAAVAGGWLLLRTPGRQARIESVASAGPAASVQGAGIAATSGGAESAPAGSNGTVPAAPDASGAVAPGTRGGEQAVARADTTAAKEGGGLAPEFKELFASRPAGADEPADGSTSTGDAPAVPAAQATKAAPGSGSVPGAAVGVASVPASVSSSLPTGTPSVADRAVASAASASLVPAARPAAGAQAAASVQPASGKAVARVQPELSAAASPTANPSANAKANVATTTTAATATGASGVRTDETPPPTFDALSQWARITITRRDGLSRTLSRAEAGDLNMLLGSAAIAAVGPRPLGGSPEWRATLQRPNGDVLAVLDVASTQVRWRENGSPAATGVPSGLALAGLREAMSDVIRPPPGAPAVPAQAEGAPHSSAAPSSADAAAEPTSESATTASP